MVKGKEITVWTRASGKNVLKIALFQNPFSFL